MENMFNENELAELDREFEAMGGNEVIAAANTFDTIDDGTYEGEILSVECKKSKAGDSMLVLKIGLADITIPIWDNILLEYKAGTEQQARNIVGRNLGKLQTLGIVDAKKISEYVIQAYDLVGARVIVELKTNEKGFQNKTYTRVA